MPLRSSQCFAAAIFKHFEGATSFLRLGDGFISNAVTGKKRVVFSYLFKPDQAVKFTNKADQEGRILPVRTADRTLVHICFAGNEMRDLPGYADDMAVMGIPRQWK